MEIELEEDSAEDDIEDCKEDYCEEVSRTEDKIEGLEISALDNTSL